MKNNVYLFSGLGADERVFAHLKFPKSNVRHIKWPAVTRETSTEVFLSKIKDQIKTKQDNVFFGVSFGGLIAQDMAAFLPVKTLIILSSLTTPAEMPRLYKSVIARLMLKITPNFILRKPNTFIDYMFSIKTNEGRNTLRDVIRDTDPAFLRWAIAYLQKWQKPKENQAKTVHRLHGSNDRIFPNIPFGAGTQIVSGGHFAVYETANEINRCLKSWL